jgi:hypothetical protein
VTTRKEQRDRYAWLRPLELMWVARTIALVEDWRDRPLAGQRRVRPWYEDDGQSTDRFGMTVDQFRAYRQRGLYGGYRVAFRKWPNMTAEGDGWTPGPATNGIAKWLDQKLGVARPPWPLHLADDHEDSPLKQMPKLGLGDKHDWWLRHWKGFDRVGRSADENTLPRRKDDFAVLPEAGHLRLVIFGNDGDGQRRLRVAREVQKAAATDHMGVCEHLGGVLRKDDRFDRAVALLPRFSRLSDAGMAAMDFIATSLRIAGESSVALADVAADPVARDVCNELRAAARVWPTDAEMKLRHIETANRFATAISDARPIECLRALLNYHEIYGGGLRWFVLRDGRVEARTLPRGGSSRYRFRLWPLCRLAAQCGVLRGMPGALRADNEAGDDQLPEDADE